jgi:tetratricopeptide (TPR) repeat protein
MYLMRPRQYRSGIITACSALCLMLVTISATAQPHLSLEIKKPQKYESRTLPSEKSTDTKYGLTKRLYSNTVSRFNYYFNANRILNDVLAAAKEQHKDDYTQLLSFYNYEPDTLFRDKMDTVLYKATAGIVLHDLRSDWVDKLYLLMGRAYLYRRDFDSATNVFQYINYAFAPKDGGYDLPVGSNASNTNGVFTVATLENRSLWKKLMSFPPGRNESFLWQVRTYIEQDELVDASSLLEIIRTDPNFPERLRIDLEEQTAYLLYKQKNYGASADHLLKALSNAGSKLETARWEYLAAQMYALAGQDQQSIKLFERAIQHTTDPLMEVYARLTMVNLASGSQENSLQRNLDELLRMAKRDKYETQRDIIYYAAAQLELKRNNYAAAQQLLLNSLKYNVDNVQQKQLSFLLLADLNYLRKAYSPSYKYYDSITTPAALTEIDRSRVLDRKPALQIISQNHDIITREDSLQKLAAMTADERTDYVRKLLRQLRKEKGLKDAANDPLQTTTFTTGAAPVDLFRSGTVGEFYFQNASLKARGLGEFRSRWGNRPNVDNWRRQSAVDRSLVSNTPPVDAQSAAARKDGDDLTLDGLMKNVPLTTEQVSQSHSAIIKALLAEAQAFQNKLEDYPSAIEVYEDLLRRYPETAEMEEALYNLAFVYKKNGDLVKSDAAAAQLKRLFPGGKLVSQLNTVKTDKKNDPAERTYESIYGMFIEGKFNQAKEAKLAADKKFGTSYWTPQLLYIESIYYIKQKDDTAAISRLQGITSMFSKSPLAEKAATMIDVLKRRKEIEAYLTDLDVNRADDRTSRGVDLNSTSTLATTRKRPDSIAVPKQIQAPAPKDLTNLSNTGTINTPQVIKKDSLTASMPKQLAGKEVAIAAPKTSVISNNTFSFNPADTQYVVLVLNNVDPIFATEARNAFNRFNQERFSDQQIPIYNRKLNAQYQFLMFGPFVSAGDAVGYIDKVKPLAGTRIVPWLAADKYSFSIISDANMNVLLGNQDLPGYKTFLNQALPGKF